MMHPQSRLAHHFASAGLVENAPVIEQAKKDAMPIGNGSPADPKRLAHAGTLLSAGGNWEHCGYADSGQESVSLHRYLNVATAGAFLTKKVPANEFQKAALP